MIVYYPTPAEQRARLDELEASIKDDHVPMAVVDYIGQRDADGEVDRATDLSRRYGTRDLRHVKLYKLKVMRLNDAAKKEWGVA